MRVKPILVTFVAIIATAGASLTAYRWEASRRPAICQICGRDISAQTTYRMDTADGTIRACCPACAMHYMLHHPGAVHQAWASDFSSGHRIPASAAYYDEGGDVQYCTAHQPAVERGPQGVNVRVYDRCLPTIVAFATREDAENYHKQHGGKIVTYNEAIASVSNQ